MTMEKEHIATGRSLLWVARLTSAVFTPFYIPFLCFLVLFLCTYLSMMPIRYKIIVLGIVYCFTILTPMVSIFLFRKINGLLAEEMSQRKNRYMPILLTIISYAFCLMMMRKLNLPWYMTGVILTFLILSVACIAVNLRWKLSEHMVGMGAVVGGLVMFSHLFGYNPVWWLSLFIIAAGVLGSARIVLGHHTLGEVMSGFTVGFLCALWVFNPNLNGMFRYFLI
ncbi:MAG: phosphatase PAP2 family protein [Mediterranea sp.]|jgi:membrane-associated phospholipid phosphatase|nr:phosphatase PAP2 family protein [Mediterranea sp.]